MIPSAATMWHRGRILFLTLLFTVTLPILAFAAEHDIIILHTNDIHCGVNDNLAFAGLAELKKMAQKETPNVLLVDAGDAIQGAPIGKLSDGESIVAIMNAIGYDFAAPGNHEFDYGMKQFLNLVPLMNYGPYSANIVDLRTGKLLLPPYKIIQVEDKKIAFVGATTPESLNSSSPTHFQDDKGNFIYGFSEDETGEALYKAIQKYVDEARAKGADYVFLVSHLGVNGATPRWSSPVVAAKTRGITGIIDGHSHEQFENWHLLNKDGMETFIAQTGTKLQTVGKIVIKPDGTITHELIRDVDRKDPQIKSLVNKELGTYAAMLEKVVAKSTVTLYSDDPVKGERIVRQRECSLADFMADAFRAVLNTDAAVINGGAVRKNLPPGNISYNSLIEAFPFENMCVVIETSGQSILDALELGASKYPEENGGLLQVSGIRYTIDATIPSSVVTDEKGRFVSVSGAYRVKDVTIDGKPLDVKKTYTLGGSTYILKEGGNGMTMFHGAKLLQDGEISDVEAGIKYVEDHLNGEIGDTYKNPYGDGRITIKE
ncbi:5'-nucleotidase C-terminal domain-containing protein [Selenomonas sp. TAMA-11512]|uniref:bifunctional metallophosphatase/5'-nucleotidase n=1 Tax=Selenomonas sp. TAMA-11512 TaxID=3095337 RepID=UPI003089A752|nr:5'-nucleotidase C-terminal domain-containing protein [Selenomonas sp. TAMA-11512]